MVQVEHWERGLHRKAQWFIKAKKSCAHSPNLRPTRKVTGDRKWGGLQAAVNERRRRATALASAQDLREI